jgi:hypothetical protein
MTPVKKILQEADNAKEEEEAKVDVNGQLIELEAALELSRVSDRFVLFFKR